MESGHQAVVVLSEYLAEAAFNNSELKAAFHRWKAALEKVSQAKTLPDPRFTFGYFIRSVETRVGPQRARYGLSQTFPWFGKLALKGDVAMQEANTLKAEYDALKWRIFYDVKKAFYEYAYLARAIEITRENMLLLQYLESVARTRYATGALPYGDVLNIQVELGKIEDRLRTLQDLRKPIMARLLAAMNRPADSQLPWPPEVPVMLITLTDEQILTQLPEHSPRIKKLEYVEAREKAGIELAQKDYWPDITFGLETIDTGEALNPTIPDSGKDPIIASVSINIPLWTGRRSAAVRETEAMLASAGQDLVSMEQKLITDTQLALYLYRDAERKIDLYGNTLIPKAEQSLGVVLEAFQSGTRNSLDLIDTERTLLEFKLAYVRALANQAQKLSELEMLLGKEIPCRIHGYVLPKVPLPEN
jgi:outer membrane protein TolC